MTQPPSEPAPQYPPPSAGAYPSAPQYPPPYQPQPPYQPGPAQPPQSPYGPPPNAPQAPYGPPLPYGPPVQVSPPQGVNGFAVASLVFGVIGGILLSVIFGIVALTQIRDRGQRGKGLAVAGLALSGVWVLGFGVLIAIALASGADRDESGQITTGGSVSVHSLRPGDCVDGVTEGEEILSLPAVPCAQPHEAEVYAVFDLDGGTWPGDETVFTQAEEGCLDRLDSYSTAAAEDESIDIFYLYPTQTSWRRGDHGVTCFVVFLDGKRTGSVRD